MVPINTKRDVKGGDWVAFMVDSHIVYGKVEYVRERHAWERSSLLVTTVGAVYADDILESRSV